MLRKNGHGRRKRETKMFKKDGCGRCLVCSVKPDRKALKKCKGLREKYPGDFSKSSYCVFFEKVP